MSEVDTDEQKRIEQEQEQKLMEKQGGQLPQKKEPLVKPRMKERKFFDSADHFLNKDKDNKQGKGQGSSLLKKKQLRNLDSEKDL
eukprot:gene7775-12249_t